MSTDNGTTRIRSCIMSAAVCRRRTAIVRRSTVGQMNTVRRDQLSKTLRSLAAAHAAMGELIERTLTLLSSDLPFAGYTLPQSRRSRHCTRTVCSVPVIDRSLLSVVHAGRICFLGNTLPFKFIARLARQPNVYVSYEDVLSEVWQGVRSDAAVRSVVKTLRSKLRKAGMNILADAIDGTVSGHYALTLRKP